MKVSSVVDVETSKHEDNDKPVLNVLNLAIGFIPRVKTYHYSAWRVETGKAFSYSYSIITTTSSHRFLEAISAC